MLNISVKDKQKKHCKKSEKKEKAVVNTFGTHFN